MEKENKVPVDKKRRWLIATILNISPLYLGLDSLKPLVEQPDEIRISTPAEAVTLDSIGYTNRLSEIWSSPYSSINEALTRTYILQDILLYGRSQQRDSTAYLLCEYLVLLGNLERAQGAFDLALSFLNRAVDLAKERNFFALEAKARYMRSYSFFERWRVRPDRNDLRDDLILSASDCGAAKGLINEARSHKNFISQPLEVALYNLYGEVLAPNTQDRSDRKVALAYIANADAIMNLSTFQRDSRFFDINADWCVIGKAQTLARLNDPRSAIEELSGLNQEDPRKKRRYLTATIAEAEAYVAKGQLDMGVAYAEHALTVANDIRSNSHIVRIANLYQWLRADDKYTRSTDVARLGIKLLKICQPEIFM